MIDCEDLEKRKGIVTVLKGYLDIFTRKWDKHSEAWNDVVIPCKIEDLHSYSGLITLETPDAFEEEKRLDET